MKHKKTPVRAGAGGAGDDGGPVVYSKYTTLAPKNQTGPYGLSRAIDQEIVAQEYLEAQAARYQAAANKLHRAAQAARRRRARLEKRVPV